MKNRDPILESSEEDARWRLLSEQLQAARSAGVPCAINDVLGEQAGSVGDAPLAAVLRTWHADNLMMEKRYDEAASIYRSVAYGYEDAEFVGTDLSTPALEHLAACHERLGEVDQALEALQQLADRHGDDGAWATYRLGALAEASGRRKDAAAAYEAAVERTDELRLAGGFRAPDLASRAARRLREPDGRLAATPEDLVESLVGALRSGDDGALRELASPTHFTVGPAGGCRGFVDVDDVLDRLEADLSVARPGVDAVDVRGDGQKRYLHTADWRGDWLAGEVLFLITRAPGGWEWSGLVLTRPTAAWSEEWRPETKRTNQPLPFSLAAPWPAGASFTAGGLRRFLREQAALAAIASAPFFGPVTAAIATMSRSLNPCGFGTRGFYYNEGPTHQDEDAFAIDFTRYRTGVPYAQRSRGTEVLAVRPGVVRRAHGIHITGSSFHDNHVYIQHEHNGAMRYESRYLHLAGPHDLRVSANEYVSTGTVLGRMNDTGNSALNHLHFSIHDIDSDWDSVRPTPMARETLDDDDDGKCLRSHNKPYRGWSFFEDPPPPIREP